MLCNRKLIWVVKIFVTVILDVFLSHDWSGVILNEVGRKMKYECVICVVNDRTANVAVKSCINIVSWYASSYVGHYCQWLFSWQMDCSTYLLTSASWRECIATNTSWWDRSACARTSNISSTTDSTPSVCYTIINTLCLWKKTVKIVFVITLSNFH